MTLVAWLAVLVVLGVALAWVFGGRPVRGPWSARAALAEDYGRRYEAIVVEARSGPLRDLLVEAGREVTDVVAEALRLTRLGQEASTGDPHPDVERRLDQVLAQLEEAVAVAGSLAAGDVTGTPALARLRLLRQSLAEVIDGDGPPEVAP